MIVTEFILWDLYDYACNTGNKHRPVPLVLDEFQNLDRSSGSPIDKMIREGRKFGLSMLLATQTIKRFNQDECAVLFQAGHKLFFKPADTEIDQFAQLLSQRGNLSKQDWGQRLANLKKGECWSLGWVQTSSGALREEAVLVSVTPLEKRFQ
jgi:DNA phosphorothioation-dependent restriction protein DptH